MTKVVVGGGNNVGAGGFEKYNMLRLFTVVFINQSSFVTDDSSIVIVVVNQDTHVDSSIRANRILCDNSISISRPCNCNLSCVMSRL